MAKFNLLAGSIVDLVYVEPDDVLAVKFNAEAECTEIYTKPGHQLTYQRTSCYDKVVGAQGTFIYKREPAENMVRVKEFPHDVKTQLQYMPNAKC